MRNFRIYALPFLLLLGLFLWVRGCVARPYMLTAEVPSLGLKQGDRVLVNVAQSVPQAGAPVAFRFRGQVVMDRCSAAPGDTLWISRQEQKLLRRRHHATDEPFYIPRANIPVAITPRNAALLAQALCRYEGLRTDVTAEGRLRHAGHNLASVTFTHDFYWMEMLSPREGFVAREDFVGRPLSVLYSLRPGGTLFHGWRKDRFFQSVD